jgi:hypothetical protein
MAALPLMAASDGHVFNLEIEAKGSPSSPNLYSFADNAPSIFIDPNGLLAFGLNAGAAGAIGAGPASIVGLGEVGGGLFIGPNPNGTPMSFGGYASGGTYPMELFPPGSAGTNGAWAAGFGGGVGLGCFFSNANNAGDLKKTQWTGFLVLGIGPAQIGLSLSWGNGIWILSFSPPGAGVSGMGAVGILETGTAGGTLPTR